MGYRETENVEKMRTKNKIKKVTVRDLNIDS